MKFKLYLCVSILFAVLSCSVMEAALFKNKTGMNDSDIIVRWFTGQGNAVKDTNFSSVPVVADLKKDGVAGFQLLLNSGEKPTLSKQMLIDLESEYILECDGMSKIVEGKQACAIKVSVVKQSEQVSPPGGLKIDLEEKLTEPGKFYRENKNKKPFEILGVAQAASEDEIKKAYKKLSLQWHADKWQVSRGKSEQEEKDASEAFMLITTAKDSMLESYKKKAEESLTKEVNAVVQSIAAGKVDLLKNFLDKGGSVESVSSLAWPTFVITSTLLGLSAYFGNKDAIRLLLAKGADKEGLVTVVEHASRVPSTKTILDFFEELAKVRPDFKPILDELKK